jgi:hypothetical protein
MNETRLYLHDLFQSFFSIGALSVRRSNQLNCQIQQLLLAWHMIHILTIQIKRFTHLASYANQVETVHSEYNVLHQRSQATASDQTCRAGGVKRSARAARFREKKKNWAMNEWSTHPRRIKKRNQMK